MHSGSAQVVGPDRSRPARLYHGWAGAARHRQVVIVTTTHPGITRGATGQPRDAKSQVMMSGRGHWAASRPAGPKS